MCNATKMVDLAWLLQPQDMALTIMSKMDWFSQFFAQLTMCTKELLWLSSSLIVTIVSFFLFGQMCIWPHFSLANCNAGKGGEFWCLRRRLLTSDSANGTGFLQRGTSKAQNCSVILKIETRITNASYWKTAPLHLITTRPWFSWI